MTIRTVGVVGAGTMGAGIAQAAALAGYGVILYDVSQDLLEKAIDHIYALIDKGVALGKVEEAAARAAREALRATTTLHDMAEAGLIVEAVPEKLALKQEIFSRLDALTARETILASNTSSLSITALAGATNHPERVIGLHFFNPAHIMRLVEIIRGEDTSDETVAAADAFVGRLGKQAVHCQDTPAFVVNRVARPFYGEAFRLLGEGAADVATIDRLMRSIGFRMGPFELIDLIGCDINYDVTRAVYEAYFQEPRYRPHPIQQRMVESGRLGRKSGRGFYSYDK
ncbi:MAG: 3-hydroxybutyryl-CoA dehydrogenase [Chloroflexi bacterium]|nr:3-hydroxybutyryl-CoA dehydrogenase [Chloroflexota bacterium]